ncbi:glycosyltransferase [Croceitalea rosinachiae]|uniref:Glycosyltransferase n=1 Tax=Croceitalea rosinachiae TaxID=3075596 RepID=A0ABU3ADI0_9FLAO|nr:glycosyltransferase [Croceitalea sp. F388]MDT0607850.1 glycosyltransferase [Croceitalea sp. F388]
MTLSIVIPLYNKEKHILRCLKSLLAQDLSQDQYEIIVVDDGSTDSGGNIALNYAEIYGNVCFFKQENKGVSAARNKGLDIAKGVYVYFMDADDYLVENTLNELLAICTEKELEILEFDTRQTNNNAPIFSISETTSTPSLHIMDNVAYISKHGFADEAWRYFVKRELLKESGLRFIEGTLYEDVIFTVTLFLKAKKIGKVAMDVHRYVMVENSIVTNKSRTHNLKFINGMIFAIEHFESLIQDLDTKDSNYHLFVNKIKERQQVLVFALIIRTLKYRPMDYKQLKKILAKLKLSGAYPIDLRTGKTSQEKSSGIYNLFVPIFNNKILLYIIMALMRLVRVP